MGGTLYIAGLVGGLGNLVGRGPNPIVVSSEDPDRPVYQLHDGEAGLPFRFADLAADQVATVDLALTQYGDFEQQQLAPWVEAKSGAGAATTSTAVAGEFHDGFRALKCTAGAGFGSRYQDHIVRAGERLVLDGWGRAVTAGNYKLRVQRMTGAGAGLYLAAGGGSWLAGAQNVASGTSTSYTHFADHIQFQVESMDVCQEPKVTLRLTCYCDSGVACFDGVNIWPLWNSAAVFGHNIDRAAELHSSDSAFAADDTTEATMAVRQPGFYKVLAAASAKRYAQLALPGTPYSQTSLAELVIGYAETARTAPRYGFTAPHRFAQARSSAPSGTEDVYQITQRHSQDLELEFISKAEADMAELRDQWAIRTAGGADTILVIPQATDPRVILGRMQGDFSPVRQAAKGGVWVSGVRIRGTGMPTIGA